MLVLRDVHKSYSPSPNVVVNALRGISLEIKDGDYLSILGPSGSGKSTLLHILGLLDIPSSGHVSIDDVDVSTLNDDQRAFLRRRKIGFVFQTFNLISSLNALENVALPLMISGVPRDIRLSRAKLMLERVGLGNRLFHKPMELSGGQRQRVAIARALINNPSVILADEPTGNLDSVSGNEVVQLFDKLNSQGKTIVVVTHDNYVAKHARKIIKIKDGILEEV